MAENDYKKALDTARAEMAELTIKKEEIEKRIAQLRQTIVGLAALSEEDSDEDIKLYIPSLIERAQTQAAMNVARLMIGKTIGLTDAVREVLKAADGWQYPTEVRDGLERMGIDTQSYSNILASIHTILKRLAVKGEVEEFKDKEGKGMSYRWKSAASPFAKKLARQLAEGLMKEEDKSNDLGIKPRDKK